MTVTVTVIVGLELKVMASGVPQAPPPFSLAMFDTPPPPHPTGQPLAFAVKVTGTGAVRPVVIFFAPQAGLSAPSPPESDSDSHTNSRCGSDTDAFRSTIA